MSEEYATKQVLITDQGNGMTLCSNCSEDLEHIDDICPKCNFPLKETTYSIYPFGGSDF